MQLRRPGRWSTTLITITGWFAAAQGAHAATTTTAASTTITAVAVTDVVAVINGTSPDLGAFVGFLATFPDLIARIANSSDFTIFAPTDAAFATIAKAPQWQSAISSSSHSALSYLEANLRYHVLPQTFYQDEFSTTPQFAHTLLNDSTYSDVAGGQVIELVRRQGLNASVITGLKQTANVVVPNINISTTGNSSSSSKGHQGVVHIIDALFQLPLNLTATLTAANLTSFAGALARANLTDTISNTSEVTIFAPTNAAFQAIANIATTWSPTQLADVLAYHVVPHTLGYTTILDNSTNVPTLAGAAHGLNVTLDPDGAVFIDAAARVVTADVLLANGVLHVIDAVLDPSSGGSVPASESTAATPVLWSGATAAPTVPFTAGQPTPSTTNTALEASTDLVRAGYSTRPTGASTSASAKTGSASSTGAAAMPTVGALGAAALFGGAGAFWANL